jgi:3-mercaptopyruvate sulfurtransferase SseA
MSACARGVVLLIAVAVLPVGCVLWPEGKGPGASAVPLAQALALQERAEAVLIDVRSPRAYARGHIPGALNIASSEIEGRAAEIRQMSRQAILYCG